MRFRYGLITGLICGGMLQQIWGKFSGQSKLEEQVASAKVEVRYWQDKVRVLEQEMRIPIPPSPEIAELKGQLAEAQETIQQLQAQLAAKPVTRDQLQRIKGIGRVFAERLYAANIHTFAQLGNLTPEQLLEIVAAEPWQKVEPLKWIEQAKIMSNEQ